MRSLVFFSSLILIIAGCEPSDNELNDLWEDGNGSITVRMRGPVFDSNINEQFIADKHHSNDIIFSSAYRYFEDTFYFDIKRFVQLSENQSVDMKFKLVRNLIVDPEIIIENTYQFNENIYYDLYTEAFANDISQVDITFSEFDGSLNGNIQIFSVDATRNRNLTITLNLNLRVFEVL